MASEDGSDKKVGDIQLDKPEIEVENEGESRSIERPSREVERYTETSGARGSVTKPFSTEKGKVAMLKDIPNVAFKLSKIKPDDNLQLLHNILFGKRVKVHTLKKNIGLFSGFVWAENEEKQWTKIKERIDKCFKKELLFFCDILNIPVNKTSTKEDLSAKLLEFLESPHVTTEKLLADKEKGKKLKRKAKASKSPSSVEEASRASSKKRKLKAEKKRKRPSKNAEESNDASQDDEEDDEDDSSTDSVLKEGSDHESKSEEEEENEEVKPKVQVTSAGNEKAKPEPNIDELSTVLLNILEEVDLKTATVYGILRQLGAYFHMDLMHRKFMVKEMIAAFMEMMTDDDDDGEEDTAEDGEGDGEYDNIWQCGNF